MAQYETRLRHLTYSIENGTFIITSELDDSFERTAKVGPVMARVAKEHKGDKFKRQKAIHHDLYLPALVEWMKYKDGDAPAKAPLFDDNQKI